MCDVEVMGALREPRTRAVVAVSDTAADSHVTPRARALLAPEAMRTTLRVLVLVVVASAGCIYGSGKRGRGTNIGTPTDQTGGPWTQGEPPSPAAVDQPGR